MPGRYLKSPAPNAPSPVAAALTSHSARTLSSPLRLEQEGLQNLMLLPLSPPCARPAHTNLVTVLRSECSENGDYMPNRLYHYRLTSVVSNTLMRRCGRGQPHGNLAKPSIDLKGSGAVRAIKDLPDSSPPSRISPGFRVFKDPLTIVTTLRIPGNPVIFGDSQGSSPASRSL